MNPNFVAKKAILPTLSIWLILFFWLVIPLIVLIVRIASVKSYSIEFYDDKIVTKSGVLNRAERQTAFTGVYSVSISQSIGGRLFGYGDISVDCPGRWDIDTKGIKDPNGLKRYLESKITAKGMTNVLVN